MRRAIAAAAAAAFIMGNALSPAHAAGSENPGNCGKDKIWDADAGKCVPKKPRGSHAG